MTKKHLKNLNSKNSHYILFIVVVALVEQYLEIYKEEERPIIVVCQDNSGRICNSWYLRVYGKPDGRFQRCYFIT